MLRTVARCAPARGVTLTPLVVLLPLSTDGCAVVVVWELGGG